MKFLIFLFPIILFLFFLLIKLWSTDTYRLLVEEDSWIEYAQFLFFFISSVFSFLIAVKFFKNKRVIHCVLYGILAAGLLCVSMEEISWGQRIFNLANPDYFEQHNWQHEISLHNLDMIRPTVLNKIYILTGFFGAFAWLFFRPFLSRGKVERDHIVNYIVPAWHISSYFFFVFFIYTMLDCIKPQAGSFLVWKDQEVAELILSLGFLLFAVANYRQTNTRFKTVKTVQPLWKPGLVMPALTARQFFTTFVPAILILLTVMLTNLFFQVSMPFMTHDVTHIAKIHPLAGILSNLGIVLWCASATICFFAAAILRQGGRRKLFQFLLFSGFLSTYLLFDDFLMVHEYLIPRYLGLHEKAFLIVLGIAVLAYFIAFMRIILRTKFVMLALALGFLTASLVIDEIFKQALSQWIGYDWKCFFEDGFKWMGIACWCSYYVHTSHQFIKSALSVSDHHDKPYIDLKTDTLHQHETDSDSSSLPVTLQTIGGAYRSYIIGAIIVIIISGILLVVVSEKITMKRSGEQTADRESPDTTTPIAGENVSPGNFLNQALAHCSGERCTNPKKAIECLNEAVKMQPDFIDAYAIRGNVYFQRGMYEHAIRDYNEVMRLNPDDVRVYTNRGTAYLMNNDKKRGCDDIQKACESGNCRALQWAQSKGFCR